MERELDHTANYLGTGIMRFRDRSHVDFEISAELRDVQMPSMVLQPLVVNAIKHGPDLTNDSVHIVVKASKDGDRRWPEVMENGKGCSDGIHVMANGGIGLRSVHDRVQIPYGDRSSFTTYGPEPRCFHVRNGIPRERSHEPELETRRRP